MSNQASESITVAVMDEESIAEYLVDNPDFFERNPDLLADIRVPHPSGDAVSLVERQIAQLRSRNQDIHSKLQNLIEVARENDHLSERVQFLTLALLDADNLEDCLQTIRDVFRNKFGADCVEFRFFTHAAAGRLAENELTDPADPGLASFENFLQVAKPVSGRLKQAQLDYLFGDRSQEVKSAVLLPLGETEKLGFLAIGSFDPLRFRGGAGTSFLTHICELIAAMLARQLRKLEPVG